MKLKRGGRRRSRKREGRTKKGNSGMRMKETKMILEKEEEGKKLEHED